MICMRSGNVFYIFHSILYLGVCVCEFCVRKLYAMKCVCVCYRMSFYIIRVHPKPKSNQTLKPGSQTNIIFMCVYPSCHLV